MTITLQQLDARDISLFEELMTVFGEAFDEMDTYTHMRPGHEYVENLLASNHFIALVAMDNKKAVGGLTAYELLKFEQERSEIYIYDLAVAREYRRQGIATALLQQMQTIAAERGAYVLIIEADTGEEDQAAIALYRKLGREEKVLHYDIPVEISRTVK